MLSWTCGRLPLGMCHHINIRTNLNTAQYEKSTSGTHHNHQYSHRYDQAVIPAPGLSWHIPLVSPSRPLTKLWYQPLASPGTFFLSAPPGLCDTSLASPGTFLLSAPPGLSIKGMPLFACCKIVSLSTLEAVLLFARPSQPIRGGGAGTGSSELCLWYFLCFKF